MIDIVDFDGSDIVLVDTQTARAANILSVQLGSLEYLKDFGIDLRYFLQPGIEFQNASFRGYLVEVLAQRGINVATLNTVLRDLDALYQFNLAPDDSSTGLVAR